MANQTGLPGRASRISHEISMKVEAIKDETNGQQANFQDVDGTLDWKLRSLLSRGQNKNSSSPVVNLDEERSYLATNAALLHHCGNDELHEKKFQRAHHLHCQQYKTGLYNTNIAFDRHITQDKEGATVLGDGSQLE
ncbi:unnamed protein product [Lupinus luteus]|uniref:Uncharacterized protein n=1 Tax=Lupinus luteus TaxID=3873 RepID=A0AAV1WYA1_LUPLU